MRADTTPDRQRAVKHRCHRRQAPPVSSAAPAADKPADMEVLLVEKDPLVRDHVKVGLQQFPEFHVIVGSGYAGINEARSRPFDCIFLGVDPREKDTVKLLRHLRSFDTTTELFVMTASRNVRDMAVDKSKYNIHSFLETPIDVREFFRLLGRFIDRRTERSGSSSRKDKGRAAAAARS
jgi:DNA-binding NtrC family response regulator